MDIVVSFLFFFLMIWKKKESWQRSKFIFAAGIKLFEKKIKSQVSGTSNPEVEVVITIVNISTTVSSKSLS